MIPSEVTTTEKFNSDLTLVELRQLSMSLQDKERSDRPLCYIDEHSIEELNSEGKQLYKQVQ